MLIEGPTAAPLREDRRHWRNNFSSDRKAQGTCHSLGNGSRGLASLLLSSVNTERVAFVPGASAAPPKACRADDNSPNFTHNSALVARSAHHKAVSDPLSVVDATLSQTSLAATNWIHSLAKSSNRANNLPRGMAPLPTLWSIRSTSSRLLVPPPMPRNLGTAFITAARFSNNIR